MLVVVIICALAAALFNAFSAVIQRQVAGDQEKEELFRKDFIKFVLMNRWWIAGLGLQVVGFLLQAAALKFGSLVSVEPLLTVDLIFIMIILKARFGVPIGKKEWLGAAAISVGLSVFFVSASPKVGDKGFNAPSWLMAVLIGVVIMLICIYFVRRNDSAKIRAGVAGLAAGISFALVAAFTKLVTRQLAYGMANLLTHWQVYALIIAGIISLFMAQNAFGAGPLALSQPVIEITEPLLSIFAGILLFGDSISLTNTSMAYESIGGLITFSGIWLLGRSDRLYIHPRKSSAS